MTTAECIERLKGARLTVVQETFEKWIGDRLGNAWLNDHYERIFEACHAEIKPIPGAREVLENLSDSEIPFCLASQGPIRKMLIPWAQQVCGRSSTAMSIPPQWSNGRSPRPTCSYMPQQRKVDR